MYCIARLHTPQGVAVQGVHIRVVGYSRWTGVVKKMATPQLIGRHHDSLPRLFTSLLLQLGIAVLPADIAAAEAACHPFLCIPYRDHVEQYEDAENEEYTEHIKDY